MQKRDTKPRREVRVKKGGLTVHRTNEEKNDADKQRSPAHQA